MKKKIRKCGYARVSTKAEEQEHSLVFQTHYYKALIESDKDAEFAGIYADTRSGKTARLRKQFHAMIQACRRGEIDYIVTKSIARFARNLVETLKIIRELREINVGIFFEKENIDTLEPKSDFMISIYSLIAEGELTSMGEQVKWAVRRRYAKGSVELNSRMYGYTLKDGKPVIVPDEAEVVKEIFTKYLSGEGLCKIAKALNERGIKRKLSAELWRECDIYGILRNEKCAGDAILQKTYREAFKKKKNNGEVPQYYVENNHEAIISREDFMRVQDMIAERGAAYNGYARYAKHPFSGKIQCNECGKTYLRRKNNRNTPYENWIWSCRTYIKSGRKYCGGHNIREKDFIRLFLPAYNEAADFRPHEVRNLDEALKDLLSQERELIALKARGYIKREDYEAQHGEILQQIRDTEDEFARIMRWSGSVQERAGEYSGRLAAALEIAEISGYTITFKFKNGAEVKRIFNNDTNRKETWAKKLQGGR